MKQLLLTVFLFVLGFSSFSQAGSPVARNPEQGRQERRDQNRNEDRQRTPMTRPGQDHDRRGDRSADYGRDQNRDRRDHQDRRDHDRDRRDHDRDRRDHDRDRRDHRDHRDRDRIDAGDIIGGIIGGIIVGAYDNTVVCESNNFQTQICATNTRYIRSIELVQQYSNSACIFNYSFGAHSNGYIWVSNGCRGRFRIY